MCYGTPHNSFAPNWSFVYIYERPILMGRLNLKMFKFGKCAHFQENAHILCKLDENACILCKLDENARIFTKNVCISSENARILLKMWENAHIFPKMQENARILRKTLPSRVTFIIILNKSSRNIINVSDISIIFLSDLCFKSKFL